MGARLVATVVPNLGHQVHEHTISGATALQLATAAFNSGYDGYLGDDELADTAVERIGAMDPDVIELLAGVDSAIEAIRAAARNGAQWIAENRGDLHLYEASLLGGPNVLVIGSMSHGSAPFEEFSDVALLAALHSAPAIQAVGP